MLSEPGEAARAAAGTDPPSRRRRVFRAAAIAVGAGWLAVIALVIAGLTITSGHQIAVAQAPAPAHQTAARPSRSPAAPHTPAAVTTRSPGAGSGQSTARHAALVAPRPPKLSPGQITETTREFGRTPKSCAPARKCAYMGCKHFKTAAVKTTFNSVQAAFDGVGVAASGDPGPGNFDCDGFSYQAAQLAADGFGSGEKVAVAGGELTLPQVPPGAPDEITARGQTIRLSTAGQPVTELGILGAGEYGTQAGTFTVNYAGGSRQKATLRFADWYSDVAVQGTVIAASALWNVPPGRTSAFKPAPVSVYYAKIPLRSRTPVVSVTLPDDPNLHLFDIGVPSAATYPAISPAFNDTGLVMPGAASGGNYDGAGHSYNASELAAKGLRPGASVIAQGIRFTWPSYGPGQLDNVRTQGQTIGITGAGRVLGFLGASTLGTQRGTVTIQYSDGSTQTAVLSFADWRTDHAVAGGSVVATVPWNQAEGASRQLVSVYSVTIPLDKGKTVVSVTLPVNIAMHVFALAEGR